MAKGRTVPEVDPLRLEFCIPGPEEKGFIRRQREATRHIEALRTRMSVANMDAMIAFLLTFVSAPADRDAARELLFDLSRADYNKLLQAILQENDDFLPSAPPTSAS